MRVWNAFLNSIAGWQYLIRHERAFQQEVLFLAVSTPFAWTLSKDPGHFLTLIGAVLLLIVIETLNTGIEAACNAVTREFHKDIKIAKDCGSLAVLMSVLLVIGVWGYAIYEYFW